MVQDKRNKLGLNTKDRTAAPLTWMLHTSYKTAQRTRNTNICMTKNNFVKNNQNCLELLLPEQDKKEQ